MILKIKLLQLALGSIEISILMNFVKEEEFKILFISKTDTLNQECYYDSK